MFDHLPASRPAPNYKKKRALMGSILVHGTLVLAIIAIQMALPEKLGPLSVLTTLYMAPPPPPPAPLSAPPVTAARRAEDARPATSSEARVAVPETVPERVPVAEPVLVAPTAVPTDIARVVDIAPSSTVGGTVGGVPGGTPGGVVGGNLAGILGGTGDALPPPPPKGPVRVGGNVREPKVLKAAPPQYPSAASRARVEGVVVIEATVTEQGNVEKMNVISGHPLLVDAALAAVKNWKYEPPTLNGAPISVILTARVNFSQK